MPLRRWCCSRRHHTVRSRRVHPTRTGPTGDRWVRPTGSSSGRSADRGGRSPLSTFHRAFGGRRDLRLCSTTSRSIWWSRTPATSSRYRSRTAVTSWWAIASTSCFNSTSTRRASIRSMGERPASSFISFTVMRQASSRSSRSWRQGPPRIRHSNPSWRRCRLPVANTASRTCHSTRRPCCRRSVTTSRTMARLTTPGCDEGVTWLVLTQPIAASPAQRARLGPFGANARPVQPLNGRQIVHVLSQP